MAVDLFRYPFLRSNNYAGAYRLLPSTKAALPILESMEFELVTAATFTTTGIVSHEAFGSSVLSVPVTAATFTTDGIRSGEAFGQSSFTLGPATFTTLGIRSSELFGSSALSAIAVFTTTGIQSGESFGQSPITAAAVFTTDGIRSAERFGQSLLNTGPAQFTSLGIQSQEQFGQSVLNTPPAQLSTLGIQSGETFGQNELSLTAPIGNGQNSAGDDAGYKRKRPLPYIRPKLERDLDDILEVIDTVQETDRVSNNKLKLRVAKQALKAIEPPPDYREAIAGISTALDRVSRSTAKHEGLKQALATVSIQLEAVIAEMQERRKRRQREEEALLTWLL